MNKSSLLRIIILFFINTFFCNTNKYCFGFKNYLLSLLGVKIGKGTKIVGPIEFGKIELSIGTDCWIGKKFTIYGNGVVNIGNNVDIAPEVKIFTGSHKIGDSNRRAGIGYNTIVKIKDGSWICGNVTILPNVIIDCGCVVAAGACVTNNTVINTLIGGIPAKVIRNL